MITLEHINDTKAYRLDEIATILNFSIRTVRRWVDDVESPLPAIQKGREYRVIGKDLKNYLLEHEKRGWE